MVQLLLNSGDNTYQLPTLFTDDLFQGHRAATEKEEAKMANIDSESAQFLLQYFIHKLRVGFALGGLHYLSDEKP